MEYQTFNLNVSSILKSSELLEISWLDSYLSQLPHWNCGKLYNCYYVYELNHSLSVINKFQSIPE